jgi:hypothetical protein
MPQPQWRPGSLGSASHDGVSCLSHQLRYFHTPMKEERADGRAGMALGCFCLQRHYGAGADENKALCAPTFPKNICNLAHESCESERDADGTESAGEGLTAFSTAARRPATPNGLVRHDDVPWDNVLLSAIVFEADRAILALSFETKRGGDVQRGPIDTVGSGRILSWIRPKGLFIAKSLRLARGSDEFGFGSN